MQIANLSELCLKIQDGTHFSPKTTQGPFRYLTSKNIRDGFIDLTNCGYISAEEHKDIYRRADVRLGDIVITKDGVNTGNCTLFDLNEEVSLLSSIAFIRTNPDKLDARYLLAYLQSSSGYSQIRRLIKGTAITRITLEQIRKIPVPVFEVSIQRKASEHIRQFVDLKSAINLEHERLFTSLKLLLQIIFGDVE